VVSAVDRDEPRTEVAARGLTPAAVTHLTRDALGTVDFAVLAPVKKLLKRFFSEDPWTAADEDALAGLVGVGTGWWQHDLDDDYSLRFGWRGGVFRIEIVARSTPAAGATFAGPVTPEATPNPRTIRFVTPPIHDGPSRWYESAATADDPRVARLFAEFDDIANVLVGPTFVAIGLRRPDRWEALLDDVLRAVTGEFAAPSHAALRTDGPPTGMPEHGTDARRDSQHDRGTALEHAWKELGALRADTPTDLERVLAAAASPNSAERQVATRLLGDADPDTADAVWGRLLDDESRSVRRATVDAMVDAERSSLRPRLEHALADTDAWTRWKALRGLVEMGIPPSRDAVLALAEDPDFRVRLEAARALS
jgi:hypothetical protein